MMVIYWHLSTNHFALFCTVDRIVVYWFINVDIQCSCIIFREVGIEMFGRDSLVKSKRSEQSPNPKCGIFYVVLLFFTYILCIVSMEDG